MSTSFRAHASSDRKYKSILKHPLSNLISCILVCCCVLYTKTQHAIAFIGSGFCSGAHDPGLSVCVGFFARHQCALVFVISCLPVCCQFVATSGKHRSHRSSSPDDDAYLTGTDDILFLNDMTSIQLKNRSMIGPKSRYGERLQLAFQPSQLRSCRCQAPA
jgi:hypothetical protein